MTLSETQKCFILKNDWIIFITSVFWHAIDTQSLLHLENITVFMTVFSRSFVAFIRHSLTVRPWRYCLTLNRSVALKKVGGATARASELIESFKPA